MATRYPCGVACGAGDLVEQQKPLEGGDWVTSALYLQGISLVRRNNEWHHFDPFGTAGVITNGSAQVVSNDLVDLFGVVRYQQGSAETPWRWGEEQSGEAFYFLRGGIYVASVFVHAGTDTRLCLQLPLPRPMRPKVPPYPGPLPGKKAPPKCGRPCYQMPVGKCQDCCERRCGPPGSPRNNQRIADCMNACEPDPDSDPSKQPLL